jgi:hypothetical protein
MSQVNPGSEDDVKSFAGMNQIITTIIESTVSENGAISNFRLGVKG